MYQDLAPAGLQVIAVDVSNDVERSTQFYEQYGYTIPVAFDAGQLVSARQYGVIATPTNYLLDAAGRVVWRHYGFRRGDEVHVRERIEALLGVAGAAASGE